MRLFNYNSLYFVNISLSLACFIEPYKLFISDIIHFKYSKIIFVSIITRFSLYFLDFGDIKAESCRGCGFVPFSTVFFKPLEFVPFS